jgi:hypothetical protein
MITKKRVRSSCFDSNDTDAKKKRRIRIVAKSNNLELILICLINLTLTRKKSAKCLKRLFANKSWTLKKHNKKGGIVVASLLSIGAFKSRSCLTIRNWF